MLTAAGRRLAPTLTHRAAMSALAARHRLTPCDRVVTLQLDDHYRFGPYLMAVFAHRGWSFEIAKGSAYRPNLGMLLRMGIGMVPVDDVHRVGRGSRLIHDDCEDDVAPAAERRGTVRLDYDYYSPFFRAPTATDEVMLPYFMHPKMYESGLHRTIAALRGNDRTIRMLFAGTMAREAYSRSFQWPYMDRHEVLQTISEVAPGDLELLDHGTDQRAFLSRRHRIVFAVTATEQDGVDKHVLSQRQLLTFASRSDFFVAPPGWRLPHSHNVIEAMSVGAVPLLSYGALFDPPLEDMKDCVHFSDRAELADKVRLLLRLPQEQIAQMRSNVRRYYDRHLAPEAFFPTMRHALASGTTIRVHNSRFAGREDYRSFVLSEASGGAPT